MPKPGNARLLCGDIMYKLSNNPILYPHQIRILTLFFSLPFSKTFFLTGGTALSAFYLGHRESQDLDFFSLEPFDTLALKTTLEEIAQKTNAEMVVQQRSQTYNEVYLTNKEEKWTQKIDFVQEQPKHFGKIEIVDTVAVDSLINIATNKILAVFGRLEVKDYIDLYAICTQTVLIFDKLFTMAKQKDTGLSEFYFASTITDVEKFETFPKLKMPFDKKAFIAFYKNISEQLLLKIKPE